MENDEIIAESVRAKISDMLKEATVGLSVPDPIDHVLTQICFEMYKMGWIEAHRCIAMAVDKSKELITK